MADPEGAVTWLARETGRWTFSMRAASVEGGGVGAGADSQTVMGASRLGEQFAVTLESPARTKETATDEGVCSEASGV